MLDSIVLERAGVPSIPIITEPFHATGREISRNWNQPHFQFLEMPHPIATMNDARLNEQADRLTVEVEKLLLEGQPAEG